MATVAIITDSTSCLPQELREEYQIGVVPMGFLVGKTLYVDNVSLTWPQFYALLKSARRLPTTASPSPGAFLEAFRRAYQGGSREILCIVAGSQLTASHSAACEGAALARQELADLRIRVIDSRCAGAALGFAVMAAARMAAAGASLEEAATRAEALIPRVYTLGVMDTLHYLAKGGRVPQVAAWLSSLLQVKPLFQLHNGQISRLGAVRTKVRAVARLLELARQRLQPSGPLHMFVFHSQAEEEAQELAEKARKEFRPLELYVSEFSQVMSIHSGPGLVGLAFYNEP